MFRPEPDPGSWWSLYDLENAMSRYLEMVDSPVHVKKLTLAQLQLLAESGVATVDTLTGGAAPR